jgi:uncharacterized coiled-coil DUF342 family protein
VATDGTGVPVEVSADGIEIQRRTKSREGGDVVGLQLRTTDGEPVAIRFAERLPPGTSSESVYVHPDYQPDETVFVDGKLLFQALVTPGNPLRIRYAVDGEAGGGLADERPEVLATHRGSDHADPFDVPLADAATATGDDAGESTDEGPTLDFETPGDEDDRDEESGDHDEVAPDLDDEGKRDEREGPTFGAGVESIEPDEADPEASFARGAVATEDPSDAGPAGPDAGPGDAPGPRSADRSDPDPGADSRNDSSPTTDVGGLVRGETVVEQLVTEIETGRVSDDQLESLREVLGVESPTHVEAKVDRVQSQIQDIEAYVAVMKSFIDEHGTATEIVDEIHEEIAEVRTELSETREQVDGIAADLEDVTGTVSDVADDADEHASRLADVDDQLSAIDDQLEDLETVRGDLDDVASLQEDIDERTASLADVSDELADRLEDLATDLEDLSERHEEDIVDVWDRLEEFDEVRSKLSQAFTGIEAAGDEE